MRFARVHKIAAYLLAILGLVALTTGGELTGVAGVLLVLGVIGSWFAEGPVLQSPRYVRTWNIVVIAVLAIEVVRAVFFKLAPLSAAVEFAALLQLSRLANRRTARDYQQITVLAMLHLIAATVLGGGLSYAACFIGFVIVTPWTMTLGHLRREIEGNYLADARAGRAGVPIDVARILRSRRVVGPGLLVGSSLLSLPVFAMTALIFVLFPRIGLGIFSVRPSHAARMTGLGNDVDLAGHGTIRDDPTIVLRIDPSDRGENPPMVRTFRLRGASFDHYQDNRWTRFNPNARDPVERVNSRYLVRPYAGSLPTRSYRIILDSLDPPVILVPIEDRGQTVEMEIEPRIEAGLRRYPELTTDAAGELRYTSTDDLGLVYTAFVSSAALPPLLEPLARMQYTETPLDLPPRIATLAHQLTDSAPTAVAKALAIQDYLRHFRYTLDLESGGAAQPLDDFLFRTRAGHCEYFSTAMAVMLRTVGVPTRNVTGFLGGTYNRYGHFYAVRQGDAHSWVEIYDEQRGWLTFDPTPPAREVAPARGAFRELDAIIEAMRVRWRRYIVSFDLGTQARMAVQVSRWLQGRQRRGVDRNDSHSRTPIQWSTVPRRALPYTAVVLALAGLAYVLFRRRRRRALPTGLEGLPADRIAQVRDALMLAHALDEALLARGRTRPRTISPVGFAEDLARRGDPIAPLAVRVANRYADARFGDHPLTTAELDTLRRALREAPHLAT